jgi:hypothetical protein
VPQPHLPQLYRGLREPGASGPGQHKGIVARDGIFARSIMFRKVI